jgi:cation:H+ antiporter
VVTRRRRALDAAREPHESVTVALLLAGLGSLVGGAELLVRGASRLALGLGIPPIVVGLTVVAFGTSAPELAVSTGAALGGEAGLAVGNVVGSNIFNVLVVLGVSALVAPLRVSHRLVRLDVPVMIAVSASVLAVAWDARIVRGEGLLLLAGLAAYVVFLYAQARPPTAGAEADPGSGRPGIPAPLALMAIGAVLLVLGARWLVAGATEVALQLGVSDLVVGLTIVAVGTSLPELATSVLASIRGERDIAVGNVVGSNILNVLAILGVAATVAPGGLAADPAAATFDIPVMTAVAVVCLPVFFSGGVIARWEGAIFLGYYGAYIIYLLLDATDHGALPAFRDAMLYFAIPLTVLTIVAVALRPVRRIH